MDAIKLLEDDHLEIAKGLDKVGMSIAPKKRALFDALKQRIEVHQSIMQNLFYPGVLQHEKSSGAPQRNAKAQSTVDQSIAELSALQGEDKAWSPAFNALRFHGMKELLAGEATFFKALRPQMSVDELASLGHRMTTERERLLQSY